MTEKLYNRCRDCGELFPVDQLHHVGLRWWLCEPCDGRWSWVEQQEALCAADNRCWAHNVMSCEDCYPERYYDATGKLITVPAGREGGNGNV